MAMIVPAPQEPSGELDDPRALLDAYLDYYRATVLRKLTGLSETDLRRSRLPSGWTPLELLSHLAWVERRWFRWGFAAEPTDDPWGDQGSGGARAGPPPTSRPTTSGGASSRRATGRVRSPRACR